MKKVHNSTKGDKKGKLTFDFFGKISTFIIQKNLWWKIFYVATSQNLTTQTPTLVVLTQV